MSWPKTSGSYRRILNKHRQQWAKSTDQETELTGGMIQVNNRDRGFARLGPETGPCIRGIATAMENVGYERESQAGDIWMRYQPRRTGGFSLPYARILATLPASAAGGWDVSWTANLDPRYDQVGQVADLKQCRDMLARATNDPDFRFLYWLDTALCLCQPSDRAAFIQQNFMPAFSNRFPAGRVILIATDSRFESRLSLLRLGNYFQINGPQGYDDMLQHGLSSCETASALHPSGVVAIENALTVLVGNFLPLWACMVGRRLGWRAVYLFGKPNPPVMDRGPGPFPGRGQVKRRARASCGRTAKRRVAAALLVALTPSSKCTTTLRNAASTCAP